MEGTAFLACALFFLGCKSQFGLSAISLLRTQVSAAMREIRLAIEMCAFASKIKHYPHLAQAWLNSGNRNQDQFEEFKEKFTSRKIFPLGDESLIKLKERYDQAAKHSHPNLRSVGLACDLEHKDGKSIINYSVCELKEGNESHLVSFWLWLIDTNRLILQQFAKIFGKSISKPSWNMILGALVHRLEKEKEYWLPVCMTSRIRMRKLLKPINEYLNLNYSRLSCSVE